MSNLTEAKAHLRKAQEFLDAARANHDHELYNAATSNAVTSGINSKDAICLRLTGRTNKTDNHTEAVGELRRVGANSSTVQLATKLGRLLKFKNKSQYQTDDMARSDAETAVNLAAALYDGATEIVKRP